MVLSTEWSQVEAIDLANDGSGFGFGIVGGRSTGVVIKSILPGGIADRDGRLQSGDHILQIGDVNLRGFSSEQAATVLRQAGHQVRIVVARPFEGTTDDFLAAEAPVVPTKALTDPEELQRHLLQQQDPDEAPQNGLDPADDADLSQSLCLPDTQRLHVALQKNELGLGITVAGYVCEREDLCGIFIKDISRGSAADRSGLIRINDRIIQVDGETLEGCTNHEAVEKLKNAGDVVEISLERYLRGPKYEHLQEALAVHERKDVSPPSPSITTLSWIPVETEIEPEGESMASVASDVCEPDPDNVEIFIDADYEAEVTEELEDAIKKKWENIVGSESRIVVAHLKKLKGLGISLEGTVDVENGVELRPHHYIRSILPEGPVGLDGKLSSGDEILEVNGQKLLGLKHVEVVKILKELPNNVRLVCSRCPGETRLINTHQDREAFATRSILGGSLRNLLTMDNQPEVPLVKAVSESSVNTSSTATVTDENGVRRTKSHSLETASQAMWNDTAEELVLAKGERGLGFSILDYQDPVDASGTVIVVRSLVPGGPAEADGRLKPGDRLVSVEGLSLKNCTLDYAVRSLKATLRGPVRLEVAKPLAKQHQEKQS